MKERKFISYTVIKTTGCFRYLYRKNISPDKDKVFKGKNIDPVKNIEEIADYLYDIIKNNTLFTFTDDSEDIYDIIITKVSDLYDKVINARAKLGLVSHIEIFKDLDNIKKVRLVFSEKILGDRSKYGLWGFTDEEADNIVYLTIIGGKAATVCADTQCGNGGAVLWE